MALNRQDKLVLGAIVGYINIEPLVTVLKDFTTKDIAKFMSQFNPNIDYYKAYDICRRRFPDLKMKNKIELVWIGYDDDKSKNIYKRRDDCRVWKLK